MRLRHPTIFLYVLFVRGSDRTDSATPTSGRQQVAEFYDRFDRAIELDDGVSLQDV
jgi:hypothetical protein